MVRNRSWPVGATTSSWVCAGDSVMAETGSGSWTLAWIWYQASWLMLLQQQMQEHQSRAAWYALRWDAVNISRLVVVGHGSGQNRLAPSCAHCMHHDITSHHITSHHITSHHITSLPLTSQEVCVLLMP